MRRLQEFLARDTAIYPEGLITGYFGPRTEQAVRRWQGTQAIEQVERVGPLTLARLNGGNASNFSDSAAFSITAPAGTTVANDAPPSVTASVTPASGGTMYAGLRAFLNVNITDDKDITYGGYTMPTMTTAETAIFGCNTGATSCAERYRTLVPSTAGDHSVTIKAIDSAGQITTKTITFTAGGCSTDSQCGAPSWAGATFCSSGSPSTQVMKYQTAATCQASVCSETNGPAVYENCATSGKVCDFSSAGGGQYQCVAPPSAEALNRNSDMASITAALAKILEEMGRMVGR